MLLKNYNQAAGSQHLKILKDRGILVARRQGVKVSYQIGNSMIRDIVMVVAKKCTVLESLAA